MANDPRPDRLIRILFIDDDDADLALTEYLITRGMHHVRLIALKEPPPVPEILSYDGLIIDQHLSGGMLGTSVARDIHTEDWRFPMMLLTGAHPSDPGLLGWSRLFDHLANKNDPDDFSNKLLSFIRGISKMSDARRQPTEAPMAKQNAWQRLTNNVLTKWEGLLFAAILFGGGWFAHAMYIAKFQ